MVEQRFNLLPHREMKRQWHRRVLGRQLLLAILLGAASALLWAVVLMAKESYLDGYHRSLSATVSELLPSYQEAQELLRQREDMVEKQRLLEQLDARRSTSVLILNDLAQSLPTGIFLTRLEEDGDKFRLEGRSINGELVAHFFEGLLKAAQLKDLKLEAVSIVEQEKSAPYSFSIDGQVQLIRANGARFSERQP